MKLAIVLYFWQTNEINKTFAIVDNYPSFFSVVVFSRISWRLRAMCFLEEVLLSLIFNFRFSHGIFIVVAFFPERSFAFSSGFEV